METSSKFSAESKIRNLISKRPNFVIQQEWSLVKRQIYAVVCQILRDQKREFVKRVFDRPMLKTIL